MSLEVIDLISDSDNDDVSPSKKATATLASFQPRKQKTAPREILAKPRQSTSHNRTNGSQWPPAGRTPGSDGSRARVSPTDQWSLLQQPNGSLADLVRQEPTASASKPASSGLSSTPELQTRPTKQPAVAKRTRGSVAEERMRKSREFYMKEAVRKAERPGRDVVTAKEKVNGKAIDVRKEALNGKIDAGKGAWSMEASNIQRGKDGRKESETEASKTAKANRSESATVASAKPVQVASVSNGQTTSRILTQARVRPTDVDSAESSSSEDVPDVVPAGLPKRKPSSISPNVQPPIKRVKELSDQAVKLTDLDASNRRTMTLKVPQLSAPGALDGGGHLPRPVADGSKPPPASLLDGERAGLVPASTLPKTTGPNVQPETVHTLLPPTTLATSHNTRYTEDEDALLFKLRDEGVRWEDIPKYFNGRTMGSLQVRYSTQKQKRIVGRPATAKAVRPQADREQHEVTSASSNPPPRRKGRKGARQEGYVSWADVGTEVLEEDEGMIDAPLTAPTLHNFVQSPATGSAAGDVANPATLDRLLRTRELGRSTGRGWSSSARHVSDELTNYVLDTLGPRKLFHGTSRDVNCVAWAADSNRFAAGSICISDERSMQYNRPYNLLLGDVEQNSLLELPEHHVVRPKVTDANNVNALHSMQETQDPRLFKTVAAVTFSQDGGKLFSAGSDSMVRMYDVKTAACLSSFNQGSTVDLLSMHREGFLATAGHRSDDRGITILRCDSDTFSEQHHVGPSQSDTPASMPVFPSALRWGVAPQQSSYLLAGFSSDSLDEQNNFTGQVCLWDLNHNVRVPMTGTERNVFDIAWNPYPSSASSTFAVASAKAGRRVRSLIQCFAPSQGKARRVLEWECPALDINDVIYCPHDDNLIAAGATDGRVYIWDKRYADRDQAPLHVFTHGATKNVLDHDHELESADTGVRFLSWSATGNRLYSGSSDGTVKVWNPYRTTENALVKNVAHFNSAVMSGAFSPDYRDLLIGEDQGQINLLSVDREGRSVRAAKQFDLYKADLPAQQTADGRAAARELVDSGQIEIRAMGAHSKRQAVQGPRYQGPFLMPSTASVDALHEEIESIQRDVDEVRERVPGHHGDVAELERMQRQADDRLKQARDACRIGREKLRVEQEDLLKLHTTALKQQQHFRDEQKAVQDNSLEHALESCHLDCAFYPASADPEGEAPDNGISAQRIPGNPRERLNMVDAPDLTNAEILEACLTSKCCSCMGPAATPKCGLPKCQRCSLKQSGLTARCSKCSAPVPLDLDDPQKQVVCQRCDFRCLRCGRTATMSSGGRIITCKSCRVQWEAGALGYEVHNWSRKGPRAKIHHSMDNEQGLEHELAEEEIERHASSWHVPLIDGLERF